MSVNESMRHYLTKSTMSSAASLASCSCPPCGELRATELSAQAHNGYWSFMTKPGHFCSPDPTLAERGTRCRSEQSFSDLARGLRGRKVVLVGVSIQTQVHFAMLCDLRRHGFTLSMPAAGGVDILGGGSVQYGGRGRYGGRKVYYEYPLHQGILVPQLGLNISFWSPVTAASTYCTAREAALQEMKKADRDKFNRDGYMLGAFCAPFWEVLARDFDVVIANPGDISYSFGSNRDNVSRMRRARLLHDVRATVGVLHRVAHANASKAFVLMDNAAQHFPSRTSSGLYEDRDEAAVKGGCWCKPSNLPASYEEPRSRVLYNALAELGGGGGGASRLRLLSYWNLTLPQWSMHVARTRRESVDEARQRHTAANGTGSGVIANRAVCDCTHFCYSPEFWRGAFFPALRRALPQL